MSYYTGLIAAELVGRSLSPALDPGTRLVTQWANQQWPTETPSLEVLTDVYRRGWVTGDAWSELARKVGVKFDPVPRTIDVATATRDGILQLQDPANYNAWTGALYASLWTPPVEVAVRSYQRGIVDSADLDSLLSRAGVSNAAYRYVLAYHQYDIPSAPMIVSMAMHGLMGPPDEWRQWAMAERPVDYDLWAKANGLGPVHIIGRDGDSRRIDSDSADLSWALHWRHPGLAELIDWQARFRRQEVGPAGLANPDGLELDEGLVDFVWRSTAIHPVWRPFYAAASRPLISIRHIRLMIRAGTIDEQGLVGYFLDFRYPRASAELLARTLTKLESDRQAKEALASARGLFDDAYDLGLISAQDYADYLGGLGLNQAQTAQAITLADMRHGVARARQAIRAAHRSYLRQTATIQQIITVLDHYGVSQARTDELLDDWRLELTDTAKGTSVGTLLTLTADGLMDIRELPGRLSAMGYSDQAVSDLVLEAEFRRSNRLARVTASEAAAETRATRAQAQALARAKAAVKSAQTALSKHGTPAQLVGWLVKDLIAEDEVYTRLRTLGWPDVDIGRLIEAARKKREAKNGRKIKPPPPAATASSPVPFGSLTPAGELSGPELPTGAGAGEASSGDLSGGPVMPSGAGPAP